MTPESIKNELMRVLIRFTFQQLVEQIARFAQSIGTETPAHDDHGGHAGVILRGRYA
jgi:phage tail sheath gpL-like